MKKLNLFTPLLLLVNLTVSYAQTGKPTSDTVKSYGVTELQFIASTLVEARACDSLLINANNKLANRDTLIIEKDITIKGLKSQVQLKSQLIDAKNETIDDCNATIAKNEKQKKLLKFGWISSIVFLGGIMTYIIVLH